MPVVQPHAKRFAQADLSIRGNPHRPCIAIPSKPSQLNTTTPKFRSDEACDVVSALAPIEARTAENSSVSGRHCKFCAEGREKVFTGVCHLPTILIEDNESFGNERIRDSHPK